MLYKIFADLIVVIHFAWIRKIFEWRERFKILFFS